MRSISRQGRSFLVVPANARLASASLELYPAQTPAARLAKSLLSLALKFRLPIKSAAVSLSFAKDAPFSQFLSRTASIETFPRFALLAGNPNAGGRRFVLLLFNERAEPVAVVKAGLGDAATRLIAHEASFLAAASSPSTPKVRATFQSEGIHALALDFFPGKSPALEDSAGLESLLSSWIDSKRQVAIGELAAWRRLEEIFQTASPDSMISDQLKNFTCHPVIYHGDFTPWNIKVSPGAWHVLDWERGEMAGMPGWDWFHYVIQTANLVKHESVPDLCVRLENLLTSETFSRYAARAGINGIEKLLVLAYLSYSIRILKQTERLDQVQALSNQLTKKWAGQK
jgi:hypothetical protein